MSKSKGMSKQRENYNRRSLFCRNLKIVGLRSVGVSLCLSVEERLLVTGIGSWPHPYSCLIADSLTPPTWPPLVRNTWSKKYNSEPILPQTNSSLGNPQVSPHSSILPY